MYAHIYIYTYIYNIHNSRTTFSTENATPPKPINIYIHIYITFTTLARHFPLKMPHPQNPSIYIYIYITSTTLVRHFPLKKPHPRNPPNLETQNPRYKLKRHQNPNLNLRRKIPRNLRVSIWWILGLTHVIRDPFEFVLRVRVPR